MAVFKAACVSLRSSEHVADNIAAASALIREARTLGADLIMTPENTGLMDVTGGAKLEKTTSEERDPALAAFRALSEELGCWLLIGSLAIKVSDTKVANRSYLLDPKGRVAASYDKIHLFDVDLPNGESYRESSTVAPGGRAALADLPWGKLGMTVCYDLRFPQLYRRLAQGGASFLSVPAAFTRTTGEAHWHTLLRARAIENLAFVFAPAQGGTHPNGRQTFGHSLIIAPWGEVLAEGGTDPGVIMAEIDTDRVAAARARVPSLSHDRPF